MDPTRKNTKGKSARAKSRAKARASLLTGLKRIVFSAFIGGTVSWYASSVEYLFRKVGRAIWNPFLLPKYCAVYGFPATLFKIGFLLFFFVCLVIILNVAKRKKTYDSERKFQYSDSGVYGTAKLLDRMEMSDFAEIQDIKDAQGTILGQLDQTGKKVISVKQSTRINKHCLIFGASQSGKTFSYVLPFALQAAKRRESLIVTDPKGELYETTAEYFREQGYVVRRFDLKNLNLSDGWDCLKEVTNSKDMLPENRADIFAEIVIKNTQSPLASTEGIYSDGPKLLLKALLLRVALDPDYIQKNTNHIGTLIEMLKQPTGAEFIDGTVFNPMFVPDEAKACLTTYNGFKQASPNLYGNLVVGLGSRLGPLDSQVARTIMGTDEIDMTLPGKRPCVYYIIMSDQHTTYNFLGALFFSFLFLDLVEYADSIPKTKKLPVPVNFLLDEFANIGTIPDFDKEMAVIRSRGVNISIICQDINQLRNRYPLTYQSIMSNAATHLCIGFNDEETETYYSTRAGTVTTVAMTEQHQVVDPILPLSNRYSTGSGQRALYSSDELARLDMDEELIVWQSKNVLKAYKFPVTSHPDYKKMIIRSATVYPSITDRAAKEAFWEEERRRIEEYDAAHPTNSEPQEKTESFIDSILRVIRDTKEKLISLARSSSTNADEETVDITDDDLLDIGSSADESLAPQGQEEPDWLVPEFGDDAHTSDDEIEF